MARSGPERLAFQLLVLILLSEDLFPVGYVEAYRRTIRGLTADPRGIFVSALLANVGRIIVAHNHPMGSAEASGEDRLFTRKLVRAGGLLNVRLEDHLIVGTAGVLSLQDLWPEVFFPPRLY